MKDAIIACKDFVCKHLDEDGNCKLEDEAMNCIMDCVYHSDCMLCVAECNEEPNDKGFIVK